MRKFKIRKRCISTKITISGKVLEREYVWYIYSPRLWGLIRLYAKFRKWEGLYGRNNKVVVSYGSLSSADKFNSEEKAKNIMLDMKNEPDKYIMILKG